MRRRSGFTFLEILFIIGIGVLLMVIMLPVFSAAKKKGRKTQCLSNLRQIGMALQMYAEDNDEQMPPYLNRTHDGKGKKSGSDDPKGLYDSLVYKTREPGIFYCGSDLYAAKDVDVFGVNHRYSSYFYNFKPPDGMVLISGLYRGGKLMIPPSAYPAVRDANSTDSIELVEGHPAIGCRHLGSLNVLYLDWHVDSERVTTPDRS